MLILTRERHEILILTLPNGDQIGIAPVEFRPEKVKLAIQAPDYVSVNRAEVQSIIDRESGAPAEYSMEPGKPLKRLLPVVAGDLEQQRQKRAAVLGRKEGEA